MKLLLDENLPHELRPLLMPLHDVFTVSYMGWKGLANGELLSRAAADGFDVLITTDRGYEHQQNLSNLPCALVLLMARSNGINDIVPLVPQLITSLTSLPPRSFLKVG